MIRTVRSLYLMTALGVTGCGGGGDSGGKPIEPATTSQQSAERAGAMVRAFGSAVSFETKEGSMVRRFVGGGAASRVPFIPHAIMPAPLPRPLLDRVDDTPAARKLLRPHPLQVSLQTMDETFDDAAADLESLLRDRVLTVTNVERSTATQITYLLKGDPTCRPLPSAIANGAADTVDPECAADLAKLQVRIVVGSDGDGHRFQVLLGPDRLELSVFIVHTDLLAWEADLDQAWRAADYANKTLNQQSEPFPFGKLQGRVKVALQLLGPKKVTFSESVLEAITIEGKPSNPFALLVGKADPALALTGDGNTQQMTVKLAQPRTEIRTPWDPKDLGAKNTDLHIVIGGLTGETTISELAQEVTFKGLGIAPSYVEVRSTHIFDLKFNPGNGGKMDLKVKALPNDEARIEITPKFDLSLGFRFDAIAAELSSPPESWLMNETYGIVLAGATPAVLETIGETPTFKGGVKIVAGALTLTTTSSTTAGITVPMGKCLTSVDPVPAGSHALLGQFTSASCP